MGRVHERRLLDGSHASRRVFTPGRLLLGALAGCVAVGLVIMPSVSSAASKAPGVAISAAAERELTAIMLRMGGLDGDAKPAWIQAVSTNRAAALTVATPGDTVPGSAGQHAYLVIMKGNFTITDAPVPKGSPAPAGHYLAVTFNPATFEMMDLGLSNRAPGNALQSFGPVAELLMSK